MTRRQYALHVARRVLESAAIAGGAAALAWLVEGAWLWPGVAALAAHVLLGPKQGRPVFVRRPGALYVYGGVAVDRNAGCRGGLVTGATGAGKTQACILPRIHSLCVHDRDWGGLVCGEKGNEWRWLVPLLESHGRGDAVRVLRTRPAGAPSGWVPQARLNLLGLAEVPADTYAKLLVEAALAVEDADRPDEFFLAQARDKIAWGIRLLRAAEDPTGLAGGDRNAGAPGLRIAEPNLVTLHAVLTVQDSYDAFLASLGGPGDGGGEDRFSALGCPAPRSPVPPSPALAEARFRLENDYWSQPADQLGGVRSTIGNFLSPYTEPEVAEVFCAGSSLSLRDIEAGCVLVLAIPQRHALQRRYITALLKALAYQVILERFDRSAGGSPNTLLIEQDEWQRYAIRADGDVDVIREVRGTTYAAAQSQNAVWAKFGGREKAAPVLANLRNRWICQGATDECAEESARFIGERVTRQVSTASGRDGCTVTASFVERPFLSKARLRALPPFHVVFAPAEGPVLYVLGIAMPVTPEGEIPPWWFGDWNPVHWVGAALALPDRLLGVRWRDRGNWIPPWRAKAPLRAQVRRLLGLDGTFIVLERMTVRRAAKLARRPPGEA